MITKGMNIEDIVKRYPDTIRVFERYGLGCAGCQAALFESIGHGAEINGINADALIMDLNLLIGKD